ncbi:DUF305 domain-containing protein [Actinosynnema sp. NPDC023658]|uniref:DUF305 domain-containing protein n=1 Tax=Actinosynnema sp. NPDC023658 TaxID=3155465 RepID=UPI00340B99D6
MTRKNLVGAALAVLTTGLVLAGCSNSDTGGHDMGSTSATPTTTSAASAPSDDHNDADISFAQEMIPHHAGAIDMAKLAQGRTTNTTVLDLAGRIEKAQDPEIKTMTEWLKAWGAEPLPSTVHEGHMSSMPGMMSAEEMDKLKAAKDADFDRLFLEGMVKHHQGAIDMATTELQQGGNTDAKELAQKISDDQQAEITEMQGLRHGGH